MIVLAAAIALAAASPPERAWAIHAGGGLALATPAFTGASRFTEFAEQGAIETRVTPRSGGMGEIGVWHAVSRRLGVAVVATAASRDAPGTFSASFPHPLYLDRPRSAEGAIPSARHRESAVHLSLVWSIVGGGVTARVSAGPSYVLAQADLVEEVVHTEAYPFDSVEVTSVRTTPVRGDALGGHAALALERRIGGRVGAMVGARWTRATVDLVTGHGESERSARVKAGGLAATAALRLYF